MPDSTQRNDTRPDVTPARALRRYPVLDGCNAAPNRPISFVCVRFSDEYEHNILTSDCVHDPLNQFITVDNRQNLFFPTLGAALNHGIARACHDLIVLVHEDVVLPRGWQVWLERSLAELEAHHPEWGLAGSVGWAQGGQALVGHFSDPHGREPINTFTERNFEKVDRLDEQILVFRRSREVVLDAELPSIHNIGLDLPRRLAEVRRNTFAVNAPTIHKYADARGALVQSKADSPKIQDRRSYTYLADKAVCDEYFQHKCGLGEPVASPEPASAEQRAILDGPLILLGRGGGGTRLASVMARDCGVFLGNDVNGSGDCMELVHAVYRGVMRYYNSHNAWLRSRIVPDIRSQAIAMLEKADWPRNWGFKVPESALILPEIRAAFPLARYMYFHRDPEGTILRRTHMTARLDNHVGRTALGAAYDHFGLDRATILSDSAVMRMAVTTRHQTSLIQAHLDSLPPDRRLIVGFAETVADPASALTKFSEFSGCAIVSRALIDTVDPARKDRREHPYSLEEVKLALDFLRDSR